MSNNTTLFADGILDASVSHGVARLTLAQQAVDGKPVACGQLLVPLSQLPQLANSMLGLLKQIESRIKEQQSASEAPTTAVPDAFRFS